MSNISTNSNMQSGWRPGASTGVASKSGFRVRVGSVRVTGSRVSVRGGFLPVNEGILKSA